MTDSSTSSLRRQNRDAVLRVIARHAPVSRTEISEHTGLTGAAVSRITRELIETRLVVEEPSNPVKGKAGRRNLHLELDGKGAYVVGVTLTTNFKSVAIGNCRGEVVARTDLNELEMETPARAIAQLHGIAGQLIEDTLPDRTRLMGCGVSISGAADPETGKLTWSDPLGWHGVELGKELTDRLSLPVQVEGRAISLLCAEMWRGRASGLRNVVLINNGLWIGGAMLMDGRIMRGKSNMAGQIAHMSVAGNETLCTCGRLGCLNATASGNAILQQIADIDNGQDIEKLRPGERLLALSQGRGKNDPAMSEAFRNAGRQMGYAVDAILSALDTELVVLTGKAGGHPDYMSGVRETLASLRPNEDTLPVEPSMVTGDAPAIWLGLEAFVFSSALDIDRLRAV